MHLKGKFQTFLQIHIYSVLNRNMTGQLNWSSGGKHLHIQQILSKINIYLEL